MSLDLILIKSHSSLLSPSFFLFLLPLSLPLKLCYFLYDLSECCKSDKAPFLNTLDSTNVTPITGSSANSNFNTTQADSSLPPNYDEIDPPPSYATLFPGNKSYAPQTSSTAPVTDQTMRRSAEIVLPNACIPPLPASLSVIVHTDGTALSTQSAPALPSSSTQS